MLCTAAVACSKKVKEDPAQPADAEHQAPVDRTGPPPPGAYGPEDLDTDACLRQRVVYFDFDQDALRPEFQAADRPATPSTCAIVRPRA